MWGKGGSPVSKGQSTMVRGTRIVTRTLNPERRKLDFFTRRPPRPRNHRISKRPCLVISCEEHARSLHVVREQMCQQSGRQMDTHAAKEE